MSDPAAAATRFGFAAVIGAPNAGKSTLVNALVGTKVTIVSHKVQTTRMPIRGIVMEGASQIVLVDTPGIFRPRRRLDRAMVRAAWSGARDADVVVLLVDAARPPETLDEAITGELATMKVPRLLALNKIDKVRKEMLLDLAQRLNGALKFDATLMISALDGSGIDALREQLAKSVPLGPWHFGADDVTDLPLRLLAAELTRERLYERLHQELPYAATVETTAWKDMGAKGVRIEQTIFVEQDSQRPIVLGKDGRTIKQISMGAREQLAEVIGRPVHLFLHVKVAEGWENDPARYRKMGLEFPKD